jgi:hypothetical protein
VNRQKKQSISFIYTTNDVQYNHDLVHVLASVIYLSRTILIVFNASLSLANIVVLFLICFHLNNVVC